jgi:hypothetical protein
VSVRPALDQNAADPWDAPALRDPAYTPSGRSASLGAPTDYLHVLRPL